jgi:hypothetical protein
MKTQRSFAASALHHRSWDASFSVCEASAATTSTPKCAQSKKDQTSCATVFTLRFKKLTQSQGSPMSNFPGWTEQIDLQNLD